MKQPKKTSTLQMDQKKIASRLTSKRSSVTPTEGDHEPKKPCFNGYDASGARVPERLASDRSQPFQQRSSERENMPPEANAVSGRYSIQPYAS